MTSHCRHCEWRNIYAHSQDGSREAELHDHMSEHHPSESPAWAVQSGATND